MVTLFLCLEPARYFFFFSSAVGHVVTNECSFYTLCIAIHSSSAEASNSADLKSSDRFFFFPKIFRAVAICIFAAVIYSVV